MGQLKEEFKKQKLTFEEYITIEQENNQKYEYYDGFIVAMSGGTLNHARISKNITSEIDSIFKKGGDKCEIFGSDAKLAIEVKNNYVYPDAMIVCGDIEESKHQNHALTNPKIIIEVLSKSTKGYDKEGKFILYMLVPSLEYYVLIEQEEPKIYIYHRIKKDLKTELSQNNENTATSIWQIETIIGIDKTLSFPTLNLKILFKDIYRKVEFEDS